MTRGGRALTTLYLTTTLYLSWHTLTTYTHTTPWTICLNTAAAVVGILAVVRELDLRDARRRTAFLEQQARQEREDRNGRPLNQLEQAMWVGLTAQLTEPDDPRSSAA